MSVKFQLENLTRYDYSGGVGIARGSLSKTWSVNWIPNGSGEYLVMGYCEHSNEHLGSIKGGKFWNQVNKSASQERLHSKEMFNM
jgi:hypothetical protein